MICIIKRNSEGEVTGWIISIDVHDARRQAVSIGENALASILYTDYEFPLGGKYELPCRSNDGDRYTMLVS